MPSHCLSGSPITQHDLTEGVFERQFTGLLGRLQTARDQARLLSAGRLCSGHWLGVWPITPTSGLLPSAKTAPRAHARE